MVVFTCQSCGECIQKPKVENHYRFKCKAKISLTCMDCFKDFRGNEYSTHTKCLTEEERYAPVGTYVNGLQKKGEAKQESWVEMIRSIQNKEASLTPSCRKLLNSISSYENIPKKKPKFINFVESSCGGRANYEDIEAVWNLVEKYKNHTNVEEKNLSQQKGDSKLTKDLKNEKNISKKRKSVNEVVEEEIPKKKKKIVTDDTVVEANIDVDTNKKFSFQEKILEILNSKGNVSLKKLEKKVLNAYLKESGKTEITDKIKKKYNKKLKKLNNVEINEDKVTLLENI